MSDLQTVVSASADAAGAHSTGPALLLQVQHAIGVLAATANEAIDGGRRPFRIPHDWEPKMAQLGYLIFRLADQTDVNLDSAVRALAQEVARSGAEKLLAEQESGNRWI